MDVKQTAIDIFLEMQAHWCSSCQKTCTQKRIFRCFGEYIDTAIFIAFEVRDHEKKNK